MVRPRPTLTPVPAGRRHARRGGCLGRALLLLVVLGGGGWLTVHFFGNQIVPPAVDGVRAVIGPEAMAQVEATYYGWVDTAHQWQRDLGLAPRVKAPWAVPTPVAGRPAARPTTPPDPSDDPDARAAGSPPTATAIPPPDTATPEPSATPAAPGTRVIDELPSTLPPRPATATATATPRPTRTPRPPRATPTRHALSPTVPADLTPAAPPPPPTAVAAALSPTATVADPTPAPPDWAAAGAYDGTAPPPLYPPINDGAMAGEGLWTSEGFPTPPSGDQAPIFWKTYLRPDPARPDALMYLVRFDPRRVRLHMVAGTKEPVSPWGAQGPGQVPESDLARLAAAFNGGWKSVHGNYGMLVNGQQIVPANPRPDTATLALHADGRVELAGWKTLQAATDLVSYRQNCPLMIDNGTIAVQDHITSTWGLSLLDEMYVWRSGLGMTADGYLIYAAGTPLSADELASGLQQAGAVYAMELDINSAWVHWLDYTPDASGKMQADPLVPDMAYTRSQYLTPTERDFFYLTWR